MKYYKTVVQVTVLSDFPYVADDLQAIHHDITHGGCSGMVENVSSEEITEEQCAEELIEQGSDPSFLIPNWEDEDE